MDKRPKHGLDQSRPTSVNVGGELWLSVGEVAFLGETRIGLLEQIGERGSITQAAKAAGISYKAAWDAVDAMNNLAPAPLVATATGGRGGGGTRLTDEGRRLIQAYRRIAGDYQRFLEGVNAALDDPDAGVTLLQRLALRTSARNQFIGEVVSVTARPVDAEVEIAIQGGARLRAGITNESVDCLGLRPGRQVWALVKSVAVRIEPEASRPDSQGAGARGGGLQSADAENASPGLNRLCGEVQRITRSDGPAEVVIALEAGITVRGLIEAERLEPLGLIEQSRACALFEPASVIIGVSD